MSVKDKKLLIILSGVVILALTYFFIFSPQAEKREDLKMENMSLESEYNELSLLASKSDDYTQKTQQMADQMQSVYDNFPSYLQIENGIMDAVAIEKSTNTVIRELTVGTPIAIDVVVETQTDITAEEGATDSANTESTADTESDTASDGASNVQSTVGHYQLYDVSSVMSFTSEYHGLKAMISEVIGSSDKKTISTLNASFDNSTGKLTGEMLVEAYFLYGLDKPYEAPYIPSVPHGTNNLFGTTN